MSVYKDKKVLITGASTGIGYALAEELNKRGAEIILTARSENKLHALAEKIKASGGKAHVFVEDLSIQGSAEALYNQIKSQNLSVDILINNAGYGRWGELTSFERDDYAEMLQLNVVTLTDLCHLYLPDMVKRGGGGIINVGSMASLAPIPYASIYSSSKAYVLMFSEAIRFEYQDKLCPLDSSINFASKLAIIEESDIPFIIKHQYIKIKRKPQTHGLALKIKRPQFLGYLN